MAASVAGVEVKGAVVYDHEESVEVNPILQSNPPIQSSNSIFALVGNL
jgi:hypothetical protein